ncbi:MAG: DegT/DnrJ/EryC1/StrS family aminotransferase [Planctomycetaceae bacterium]
MSTPVASTVQFPVQSQEPIPLITLVPQYQSIKAEIDEAVQRVFTSQAFIMGEEVANFEADMAKYCDSREAIGCASGTDALVLALQAAQYRPGRRSHHDSLFLLCHGQLHRTRWGKARVCRC